jgi:hypothetical protein
VCVYDIEVHKSRSRMHVVLGLPGPHLQFANRQAVQRSSEKRKLLCIHMITQDIPFQQSSSDLCNRSRFIIAEIPKVVKSFLGSGLFTTDGTV